MAAHKHTENNIDRILIRLESRTLYVCVCLLCVNWGRNWEALHTKWNVYTKMKHESREQKTWPSSIMVNANLVTLNRAKNEKSEQWTCMRLIHTEACAFWRKLFFIFFDFAVVVAAFFNLLSIYWAQRSISALRCQWWTLFLFIYEVFTVFSMNMIIAALCAIWFALLNSCSRTHKHRYKGETKHAFQYSLVGGFVAATLLLLWLFIWLLNKIWCVEACVCVRIEAECLIFA